MLRKAINDVEFKNETLPDSYFLNYFEKDFLPKIKEIYEKLQHKCNEPSDSLKEAELKNEFAKIIG